MAVSFRFSLEEKEKLLNGISFGESAAEDEYKELEHYFVETHYWRQLRNGAADIIYGPKGSGKSALYSLLLAKTKELSDQNILVVTAENPRGELVFENIADKESEDEHYFEGLWKLYFLLLIARVLQEHTEEYGAETDDFRILYTKLRQSQLMPEKTSPLKAVFISVRDYMNRISGINGQFSGTGAGITIAEPAAHTRPQFISVDDLLKHAESALGGIGYSVWILLDRLDMAFGTNEALEGKALRALFKVYRDMKNLEHIDLKIFLRTDVRDSITEGHRMPEFDKVRPHSLTIEWEPIDLQNLVVRRFLKNDAVVEYCQVNREAVLGNVRRQEELIGMLFPAHVERDTKGMDTFKWILTRTQDGKENAPRELINFLRALKDKQIRALERNVSKLQSEDHQLFEQSAFKEAWAVVSTTRLKDLIYPNYPSLRDYMEALRGKYAENTLTNLSKEWDVDLQEARRIATRLVNMGFFERKVTKKKGKRRASDYYYVPFLYRSELGIIGGGLGKVRAATRRRPQTTSQSS